MTGVTIRRFEEHDSYEELTELLHAAYKELADLGFRYLATHQDAETTRERCRDGECYLAEEEGAPVGTICFYPPGRSNGCPWYQRSEVATFGQFGVLPGRRGRGIGTALLDLVESRARELGAQEIALDTAEGAHHLIDLYKRRGYRFIERVDWPETNYISVVLSKALGEAFNGD